MAAIKVVSFYGGSVSEGDIPAHVGMATNEGIILTVSGNLCEVGSGTAQSNHWQYDSYLTVLQSHAENFYGWPSGVDVNRYSHTVVWPNGIPFDINRASGTSYHDGTIVHTYGR